MNIKDHILIEENGMPLDFCKEVINQFERLLSLNTTEYPHQGAGMEKGKLQHNVLKKYDDNQIFFQVQNHIPERINRIFYDCLYSCYRQYAKKYAILEECGRHVAFDMKVHKVLPSGGYHAWHAENMTYETSKRVLVYTCYLNDIPEGEGETEFLYQGLRIQPKAGTIAMWPAYFTYTHRGNPVYTTEKYYITGWYVFIE